MHFLNEKYGPVSMITLNILVPLSDLSITDDNGLTASDYYNKFRIINPNVVKLLEYKPANIKSARTN